MNTYKQYKKAPLDLSSLGFLPGEERSLYLDTPKGANVIGWAGVDGVHYCFVKGLGDMVFAVHPLGEPNVVPIAENFTTLLRLLLSCGHMAVIDQAHLFGSPEQFAAFQADNPVTPEAIEAMENIRERFGLTPLEEPYAYLCRLRESFDFATIPFRKSYYDSLPPREEPTEADTVYWDSSLHGTRKGTGKPGVPLTVDKHFRWADEAWYIPAVYVCGRGLVVDFCLSPDKEKVVTFLQSYETAEEEERLRLERVNPLDPDFSATVQMGKYTLTNTGGSGTTYLPPDMIPTGERAETTGVTLATRYGLDTTIPWVIHRMHFPWVTTRAPKMVDFTITLHRQPQALYAPVFATPAVGETVSLAHPLTGQRYSLTCIATEETEVGEKQYEGMQMPTHMRTMRYKVTPSCDHLQILALGEGDSPRKMTDADTKYDFVSTMTVGIIGGADGPTAVLVGGNIAGEKMAVTPLYFDLPDETRWQPIFRETLVEDKDVVVEI